MFSVAGHGQGFGQVAGRIPQLLVAAQPGKTGRTVGQHHGVLRAGLGHAGAKGVGLVRAHGHGNIRPAEGQGAGFATAVRHRGYRMPQAGQKGFRATIQGVMAGGMVELAGTDIRRQTVFNGQSADVGQRAAEKGCRLHAGQGLATGAAAHRHGGECQMAEAFADLAEDHRGTHGLAPVHVGLGVDLGRKSAAEKGRRQDYPQAGANQDVDRRQGDPGVQPLGATPGKVENRAASLPGGVDDHRLIVAAGRQAAEEGAGRNRRHGRLQQAQCLGPGEGPGARQMAHEPGGAALDPAAGPQGRGPQQGVGRFRAVVQIGQGHGRRWGAAAIMVGREDLTLQHRNRAGIDIHRAGRLAFVADGAVVGHLPQVFQGVKAGTAKALGFPQDRLDQGHHGEVLVARVEKKIFLGMKHAARGFAAAAAHAAGDHLRQTFQFGMAQDAGFQAQQVEGGSEDQLRRARVAEFARIHEPVGVHLATVVGKLRQTLGVQVFELGQADAVLAADHAVQFDGLGHDRVGGFGGAQHHLAVVGEHGDVDMDVAVAGVHVGSNDDQARAGVGHDLVDFAVDLHIPAEQFGQFGTQLPDVGFFLQVMLAGQANPFQGRHEQFFRGGKFGGQPLGILQRLGRLQMGTQAEDQRQLVLALLLGVDIVGELGELGQGGDGQDDVLVELEGAGAFGDGAQAFAVAPEAFGLLIAFGHEKVGVGIGAHERFKACQTSLELVVVVGHHVHQENRLGGILARCLDLVADGTHVGIVEMLQGHKGLLTVVGEGLADGGDGPAGLVHVLPEKFQAAGGLLGVGAVQDESGRGDDAVGAFLLNAGQAGEGLVGDILAQAGLTEIEPLQGDGAQRFFRIVDHIENNPVIGPDPPQTVRLAPDGIKAAVGHGDLEIQEVVDGRAPKHGHLAAGIFGNVAADGAGPGAGGVGGEDQAGLFGIAHGRVGDHPRFQVERRRVLDFPVG
ncbi:hypothetical protein DESC_720094 [Desulfosarcina cetonica]|nr:hypothetical protein DESC_720094 [Desulfosarcina cetonica]